ncbi:TM2 domain-containing protein [Palleronia aestuarii]|uniref:TM2 domain-containing protein n=2 Tax=Palleronia aestuarii TaxID=568105 RepID=A0A2W7NWA4_9RHOB|nr:TM2 domain-containing protein [Palleronia aestuarii]
MALGYLLLILAGGLGAHRFYLGRIESGVAMILLTAVGWSAALFLGVHILLGAHFTWWIIDLFLLPEMIREEAVLKNRADGHGTAEETGSMPLAAE